MLIASSEPSTCVNDVDLERLIQTSHGLKVLPFITEVDIFLVLCLSLIRIRCFIGNILIQIDSSTASGVNLI